MCVRMHVCAYIQVRLCVCVLGCTLLVCATHNYLVVSSSCASAVSAFSRNSSHCCSARSKSSDVSLTLRFWASTSCSSWGGRGGEGGGGKEGQEEVAGGGGEKGQMMGGKRGVGEEGQEVIGGEGKWVGQ